MAWAGIQLRIHWRIKNFCSPSVVQWWIGEKSNAHMVKGRRESPICTWCHWMFYQTLNHRGEYLFTQWKVFISTIYMLAEYVYFYKSLWFSYSFRRTKTIPAYRKNNVSMSTNFSGEVFPTSPESSLPSVVSTRGKEGGARSLWMTKGAWVRTEIHVRNINRRTELNDDKKQTDASRGSRSIASGGGMALEKPWPHQWVPIDRPKPTMANVTGTWNINKRNYIKNHRLPGMEEPTKCTCFFDVITCKTSVT